MTSKEKQKRIEENRARAKAWYWTNKARKQAYDKKYAAANREQRRKTGLAYYHRHPERQREWERLNPEAVKLSKNKWAKKHPEKLRAKCVQRRARLAGCKSDGTADAFYAFVRAQETIPCYYCKTRIPGTRRSILSFHRKPILTVSRC